MTDQPSFTPHDATSLPKRVPNQFTPGTNLYKIYDAVRASNPQPVLSRDSDVNSPAGAPGFDNAPAHYKTDVGIQSFDVIDAYGLDFYTGNAWKYLARWNKKGNGKNDLEKAAHYLQEALTRAPAETEDFFDLADIDLKPSVVLPAFGFDGLLYDAALDLLLSRTTRHPRTYLRSAKAQVEEALKDM